MSEPIFSWDEKNGIASCIITYKDRSFVGIATCHPEDEDMKSSLTGQQIAEHRATIEYLKFIRDCEIKPELKSLNQLYFTMAHSKKFNPKSYENKRLQTSIHMAKSDLEAVNKMIDNERKKMYQYINQKEAIYRLLRSKRFVEGQEEINKAVEK